MAGAFRAGLFYFAIVFAAGFALGTLRVLVMIPRIGETAAVLAEMPVMLLICWRAARWILQGRARLSTAHLRILMGGSAFLLLMVAELLLSVTAFGRTPAQFASDLVRPLGLIGLAGQIAFGALPWLLWQLDRLRP